MSIDADLFGILIFLSGLLLMYGLYYVFMWLQDRRPNRYLSLHERRLNDQFRKDYRSKSTVYKPNESKKIKLPSKNE